MVALRKLKGQNISGQLRSETLNAHVVGVYLFIQLINTDSFRSLSPILAILEHELSLLDVMPSCSKKPPGNN